MKAKLYTSRRDAAWMLAGAAILVLAALAAAVPSTAAAAGFQVTKTADTADGSCDSDCSLREAVIAANASPDHDTIILPPGRHTLSRAGMGEDAAATGDLDIRAAVTIRGSRADRTTVDGGYLDRVFHTPPQEGNAFGATISGLTITRGGEPELETSVYGGGIRHQAREATLSLVQSAVARNVSSWGGGILNEGNMTIARSTISDQRLYGRSNAAGIGNVGKLTMVNSTVSRNYSAADAGIQQRGGTLTIRNSTIAFNRATQYSGSTAGIAAYRGLTTLRNTIVAKNRLEDLDYPSSGVPPHNCWGKVTSRGHNLENGKSCGFTRGSDVRGRPMLGPLERNGGPTLTHRLLAGSPAIDAGGAPFPRTDQRGVARPQGRSSDIGAFERRQR